MKKLSRWIAMFFIAGYLFSPVDIAPDVIPGVGWIDDPIMIIVMLWASGVFEEEQPTYRVIDNDKKYLSGD